MFRQLPLPNQRSYYNANWFTYTPPPLPPPTGGFPHIAHPRRPLHPVTSHPQCTWGLFQQPPSAPVRSPFTFSLLLHHCGRREEKQAELCCFILSRYLIVWKNHRKKKNNSGESKLLKSFAVWIFWKGGVRSTTPATVTVRNK